jgi:hypothetical protein
MDEPESVRWTISVPKETDVSLRTYLAQSGLKKGDLSEFVADAVRWRLFDLNVTEARAKNADVASEEIDAAIDEALAEVRAERFRKPR